MSVLAIDAGTTGVTALVVGRDGTVVARGYQEFTQYFPNDGWVEHDPDQIWQAVLAAVRQAVADTDDAPTALGLTNQRETVVFWDRQTLGAPRRAIVWQDRRTAGICEQLRANGVEPQVQATTGLRLDPYFSASKIAWVRRHDAGTWAGIESGQVAIGTVDSYLVARLTGGARHLTDASNASRTLLFDLATGDWSPTMCELFEVPKSALPQITASWGVVGRTDPASFLGLDLPIAGIAGDQQAALFGQTCFQSGDTKCTYGTGSFVLTNTGSRVVESTSGLLSTVAWRAPDGQLTYALEGAVFVTGAAVQWLRDGLGILADAAESEALGRSVPDSAGVVFVPALTGLGAPDWDPYARGAILGITRATTAAHIARATLEAIAFEVRDVATLIVREAELSLTALRVDGGASANNLLCQLQADQLQIPVSRPEVVETTALGAAFLAGLGARVWADSDELRHTWRLDAEFAPRPVDESGYQRWRRGVERAKGWADG